MKVFLTTVAGTATRFSESVGKPTIKCLYNSGDEKKTLLSHMLTQAESYDKYIIVGGFLIDKLKEYINRVLPSEQRDKVILVDNRYYKEYGSGWSLYCGLKEAMDDLGEGIEEILFAEGDLFVDDNSFNKVINSENDVITHNNETIKANKAVALYFDINNIPHYIYDTSHGQLSIDEPFIVIYNSGQIWKFRDVSLLFQLMNKISVENHQGTNLVLINEYFQTRAKSGNPVDMVSMSQWLNCNTISDFEQAGL